MTLSLQKWGNSHGIRLPKHLLEYVKWNENEKLLVTVENGRVIIEKDNQSVKKNISELFADYDGVYETEEIDWGEPEGNEIW